MHRRNHRRLYTLIRDSWLHAPPHQYPTRLRGRHSIAGFAGPRAGARLDQVAVAGRRKEKRRNTRRRGQETATPAELAAIMSEVQQLGSLDPAAQMAPGGFEEDRSVRWPQLVQTFRASIAYRRQSEERTRLAAHDTQSFGVKQTGFAANQATSLPTPSDAAVSPKSPAPEFAAGYPDTKMPPVRLASATAPVETSGDWRNQLASRREILKLNNLPAALGRQVQRLPRARRQYGCCTWRRGNATTLYVQ